MTDSLQPLLVSKKQAAQLLNVSLRTIGNFISCKKLRPRKIGRRCLIPYRQLVAFSRADHTSPKPIQSAEK